LLTWRSKFAFSISALVAGGAVLKAGSLGNCSSEPAFIRFDIDYRFYVAVPLGANEHSWRSVCHCPTSALCDLRREQGDQGDQGDQFRPAIRPLATRPSPDCATISDNRLLRLGMVM
jgi:hypothetical protein